MVMIITYQEQNSIIMLIPWYLKLSCNFSVFNLGMWSIMTYRFVPF